MASVENKRTILNRIFKFFNLGLDKSRNELRPTQKTTDGNNVGHTTFFDLPPQTQKFYDYWMNSCHDDAASFENRELLYSDIDMIYLNSPILSRGIDITRDESYQADANFKTIGVDASPRVRDFLLEHHDNIGLEQHIPDAADSIVKYGNHGWVLGTNDTGVSKIIPINIFDLVDRIEFSAHHLRQKIKDTKSNIYRMTNSQKMKMLIDNVLKTTNVETYLETYLFGFQVGDFILPPWKFIHFRNLINNSPFAPFGQPMFLHAIAPYRQYDAAMTLQVAARSARFPIFKHEIDLPNVPPSDKLAHAVRFVNLLQQSGMLDSRKEEPGVGEHVVTIKGLYDYTQETPDIDLGRMDDIEALLDGLDMATGLPRSFLDANKGSFGNSGYALAQQFRPFGRRVYRVQQILLEGISQMDKIHLILSGKFKEEEIEFQLTMPYPESQIDRDMIGAQGDLLDLSNKIFDMVGQRIVGDPNALLPPDLVRQVLTKILPWDGDTIKRWMNSALVSRIDLGDQPAAGGAPAPQSEPLGGGGGGGPAPAGGAEAPPPGETPAPEGEQPPEEAGALGLGGEAQESTRSRRPTQKQIRKFFETVDPVILNEAVSEEVFKAKNRVMSEGSIGGRHFYSSRNKPVGGFDPKMLWQFKDERIARLTEEHRLAAHKRDMWMFGQEVENPLEDGKREYIDVLKKRSAKLREAKEARDRKLRENREARDQQYRETYAARGEGEPTIPPDTLSPDPSLDS